MAVRVTRAGVGLIIGIVILGLIVLGGLYFVKERGEQARRDEAIKIAEQNLESQSENGALTPPDSDTDKTDTTSTPAAEQPGSDVSTAMPAGELPQTGSADFMPLIAVGLLSFATASYVASRRTLRQLDF